MIVRLKELIILNVMLYVYWFQFYDSPIKRSKKAYVLLRMQEVSIL